MNTRIEKNRRALIFYSLYAAIIISTTILVFWTLHELILPASIGAILAYVCLPIIDYLRRKGLPRIVAILLLFFFFYLGFMIISSTLGNLVPGKKEKLELQIRIRYKIRETYRNLMGLNTFERKPGNLLYTIAGKELDPLHEDLDQKLSLSENDRFIFENFRKYHAEFQIEPVSEKYWNYHLANLKQDDYLKKKYELLHRKKTKETDIFSDSPDRKKDTPLILQIVNVLSLWFVMPLVFLIFLFDNGKIRKFLIGMVPNRYFEVSLTVYEKVNEAIGNYLRGTSIECGLVGASFTVCLYFAGIEIQWALLIGAVAGISNAIPFLGPLIGLVAGLSYALLAESIDPILPFVNLENLVSVVLGIVVIVQLLDNALFQPFILGNAVNLHPLVVVFSVLGGSFLFGMTGMLLAIPTVVIVNVVLTTLHKELKTYSLI